MTQRAYMTNDIESHGRILLIPVALTLPVVMGAIGKVPLFQQYLTFYVTMLALGTAMAICFFLFESKTEQKVLTMDLETVSFHDFGRHTLFWREISGIGIEQVESTKMKGGAPVKVERVVIRGRRTGTGEPERFALQFNYGMSNAQLCAVLTNGWEEGLDHYRRSSGSGALGSDRVATPLYRPMAGGAPGGFGRRRSDARRAG